MFGPATQRRERRAVVYRLSVDTNRRFAMYIGLGGILILILILWLLGVI